MFPIFRKTLTTALVALTVATTCLTGADPVRAQDPSAASAQALSGLSLLPVASLALAGSVVSAAGASVVTAPAVILSATTELLVVSAQASAHAAAWILESAADGSRLIARFTVRTAAESGRLMQVASGQRLRSTPVAQGWLLSRDDEVIAFVPRSGDSTPFHHERLR